MRVRWNGNTYFMTWICVFDNVRIRARWIGPYAWRSVRTPFRRWALIFHGMFVGILRSVLCVFRWRTWFFHGVFATLSQTVSSRRGRFIVPAYTYTPTKWGTEMRIRWNGYVYLVMLGYGRDESSPTPDGMFRGCFRNVRHTFRGRMLHY